jgi:hypothetical protein
MIPSGRAETATRERSTLLPALLGMLLIVHWAAACGPTLEGTAETAVSLGQAIALPHPSIDGPTSVERALASRRSRRVFGATPLTLAEAGQLLWAAQGATDQRGQRTAPSAGGLYPLDVYLVAGGVEGLEPAVYGYSPAEHALRLVVEGDRRADLGRAALDQDAVREARQPLSWRRCTNGRRENTGGGAGNTCTWRWGRRRRTSTCRPRPWPWERS